jgi:hypothetical protein
VSVHRLVSAIALCVAGSAHAIYKCPQPGGGTSFQERPCSGGAGQSYQVRSTAAPTAPAAPSGPQPAVTQTVEQRVVKEMERERRIRETNQEISETEARIERRNAQMNRELAALQNAKTYANNNLAGATYQQSLSTEMQALASKYQTMNDVDIERLKTMRSTLATLQAGNSK